MEKSPQMGVDEEELKEEDDEQLSMTCTNCFQPFDLNEYTPYILTCAHTACKQCLRLAHKNKSPFVCEQDDVVVPLTVIKTLSKNLQVIKFLREREALLLSQIDDQRDRDFSSYLTNNKKSSVDFASRKSLDNNQPPNQTDALNKDANQLAKDYFPSSPSQREESVYKPPNIRGGKQNIVSQQKQIQNNQDDDDTPEVNPYDQQEEGNEGVWKQVKPKIEIKEVASLLEIPSNAVGEMSVVSGGSSRGKKKKSKKKKKKNQYSGGNNLTVIDDQQSYYEDSMSRLSEARSTKNKFEEEQKSENGTHHRSQSMEMPQNSQLEKAILNDDDTTFYQLPTPLKESVIKQQIKPTENDKNEDHTQDYSYFPVHIQEHIRQTKSQGKQEAKVPETPETQVQMNELEQSAQKMPQPNEEIQVILQPPTATFNTPQTKPEATLSRSNTMQIHQSNANLQPINQRLNFEEEEIKTIREPELVPNGISALRQSTKLLSEPGAMMQDEIDNNRYEESQKGGNNGRGMHQRAQSAMKQQPNVGLLSLRIPLQSQHQQDFSQTLPPKPPSATVGGTSFLSNRSISPTHNRLPGLTTTQQPRPLMYNLKPLPQPLTEFCPNHQRAQVKYLCREPTCMIGLCPDCILLHSKHDIIAANEFAAAEVKQVVRQAQRLCKKQAKHLKTVRTLTEQKLEHLSTQRDQEFSKLNQTFTELRSMLDKREEELQLLFNSEIKPVESRLKSDIKHVHECHSEYVNLFKELKNIGEKYTVSTDVGIVSHAQEAWQLYQKTQELVELISQNEKILYIIEIQDVLKKQEEDFELNNDPHKDLKIPSFKLDVAQEKEKLQTLGQIFFKKQTLEQDDEDNTLLSNPLYTQQDVHSRFIPQDTHPQQQQLVDALLQQQYHQQMIYQQQQQQLQLQHQQIPADNSAYYFQTLEQMILQQQQQQLLLQQQLDRLLNPSELMQLGPNSVQVERNKSKQPVVKIQDETGEKFDVKVIDGEEITIKIVKQENGTNQDIVRQASLEQKQKQLPPLRDKRGRSAPKSTFSPIVEVEDSDTSPPHAKKLNQALQTLVEPEVQKYSIGVQSEQEPPKQIASLKNKKIQTKKHQTSEIQVQVEAEYRCISTQTATIEEPTQPVLVLPPIGPFKETIITQSPKLNKLTFQNLYIPPITLKECPYPKLLTDIHTQTFQRKKKQLQTQTSLQEVTKVTTSLQTDPPIINNHDVLEVHHPQAKSFTMQTEPNAPPKVRKQTVSIQTQQKRRKLIQMSLSMLEIVKEKACQQSEGVQTVPQLPPTLPLIAKQPSMISLKKKNSERRGSLQGADVQQQSEIFRFQQQFVTQQKNLHWFRWDSNEVYRLNPETKDWTPRTDLRITQKFMFFSAIQHLPNDQGCFIMGGSDNEDNYSKRVQYFCKYNVFIEKPQMINRRAFFCSLFNKLDNAVYAFGGSDSNQSDLCECEKFSLAESVWRPIAPMKIARNGTACCQLEQYRLVFVFGGNSHLSGSLDQIEKYDIDFDKWTIIDVKLTTPIHDMGVMQVSKDRVLIFGGHTELEGANKEIQVIDFSLECFKSRFGNHALSFAEHSACGKTYFPPTALDSSNKISLIFGYCDQPPVLEDLDISDFLSHFSTSNSSFYSQKPFAKQQDIASVTQEKQNNQYKIGISKPQLEEPLISDRATMVLDSKRQKIISEVGNQNSGMGVRSRSQASEVKWSKQPKEQQRSAQSQSVER